MNYQTKCDHCGHAITAYTHNLNSGKVAALRRLIDQYESTKSPVALGDLGISNSQYTGFCHLTYFDLVRHIPEGWIPTMKGIAFIHGEIGVIEPVMVMASQVLPYEHEAWKEWTGERHEVFVFDINNTAYKRRPEFAAEKSQAVTLFG